MARKTTKKEKYITLRTSAKGTKSYEICIRHKSGQTFRKSILISDFDTPRQALEFARVLRDEKMTEMNKGITVKTKKTVRDMYNRYHELYPVRIKTKTKHDLYFRNAIEKYADKPITEIKPSDITECVNAYAENHSRHEVQSMLSVWRGIYKACALDKIMVLDATIGVRVPECPESKTRVKAITSEEYEEFITALLDYNSASVSTSYVTRTLYIACEIMRYCGLRPAETFALTVNDVNFLTGYITINKALHSTKDSILEIGKVKTETSKRRVPIPEGLKPVLKEALSRVKNEFLLTDINGNLISIETAHHIVTHVKEKNPGIKFNFYCLRHQFSTDLNNGGIPLNVIRDLMGHKNASMTIAYATSSDRDRTEAINSRKFS